MSNTENKLYDQYVERVNQYNKTREDSANSINGTIKSYNEAKVNYEQAKIREEAKIAELQRLIEIYEKWNQSHG